MSGGGKTQTSTSSVQIPPEVLARYNAVNARAENVASTPFQAYSYDPNAFVAPMTETQNAAIGQIGQASGMAQPYFQTGAAATLGGMGPANLGELDTNKYMSPYLQNVVQSTADILGQQNRQDMSGALGTAIQSGAGFGDRSGIAAANLNRQQMMGMGSTIGNLLNQGYTQAQGVAQQQQSADLASRQANLARLLQGGQNIGQLGAGAQGAALAGSQALLGAGTQQQQTEQAGKSALYNQYQQERAYPFQTTQFLGNLAMGTGALTGSTTQTTSPAGFFSGFKDGGKVIEGVGYRRGGLVPESMGGHVNAGHMGEGYADGGSPQTDYATMVMQQLFGGMDPNAGAYGRGSAGIGSGGFVPQANLPVGQLMIANPVEAPAQTNASDLVDMASSLTDTGEKAGEMWEKYSPKPSVNPDVFKDLDSNRTNLFSRGGTTRSGLAAGGIPYDPSGSGYVPVQEPGTQKTPELLQPKNPQQPESGLSKVADLAKIVGMFMANGGVAGRRGYAGGGRPEDETGLTLEQELLEYARRRPASALYDPGPQNLPREPFSYNPGQQNLPRDPFLYNPGQQNLPPASGLSYDPRQQNLPPEGVTVPTPGQELAELARRKTASALYGSGQQNLPPRGITVPTPGQEMQELVQLARRKAASGLSYDPGQQNLPPEGITVPTPGRETAEAYYLKQLRDAPLGTPVKATPGISAADAERISRDFYTRIYANPDRPVQLFNEQLSDIGLFPTKSDLEFFNSKAATPSPARARVRELPFNQNASAQGAQAENAAYVGPDAATRLYGAATSEDSIVDAVLRGAVNTPAAVSDATMRAVDRLFLGPTEYSQKYPTATAQPDYIGGVSPAWSRSVGARAEDRSDLNVFNPYASVQGPQIGQPQSEVREPVERGLTLPPYIAPDPDSELRNVSPVANMPIPMPRLDRRFTGVQPGLSSANYSAATNIPPIPMPRLDRSGLGAASTVVPAADPAKVDLTGGVTPLAPTIDGATTAEPVVEPQPGLAAGTGTGAPAVGPGVDAASVIRVFEGFSPETYWDVNHHRGGYGSDTITRADGTVEEVKRGMTFSREDAERDLSRRIAESQTGISKKIGADVWSALPGNTQTALTSIAYNYGSLPNSVAEAARSGDQEKIAVAIEALGGHNDGVNRARRYKEAALVRGGALSDFSGGGGGGGGGGTLGNASIPSRDVPDTRPDGGRDDQPAPGLGGKNLWEQMVEKANGAENIILPFLSGLGKMAGSQSRFLGTALLEGVGGGAEAYMNRQKQLADIGQTKSVTLGNIANAYSNMLVNDGKGNLFVPLQGGGYQPIWDFISNPKGTSILGGQADRLLSELSPAQLGEIVKTVPDAAEGTLPAKSEAPGNIIWNDNADADAAYTKSIYGANANTPSNFAASGELLTAIDESARAAMGERKTLRNQAKVLTEAIAEGNTGSLNSYLNTNILGPISSILTRLGLEMPAATDPVSQMEILQKEGTRLAAAATTASEQRAVEALNIMKGATPGVDMTKKANAAIMASILQQNQDQIDRQAYYGYYQSRTGGLLQGAEASYNDQYAQIQAAEYVQLAKLFEMADQDPRVTQLMKIAASGAPFNDVQGLLTEILGKDISPALARLITGGT